MREHEGEKGNRQRKSGEKTERRSKNERSVSSTFEGKKEIARMNTYPS